jgi:hypothetical protein
MKRLEISVEHLSTTGDLVRQIHEQLTWHLGFAFRPPRAPMITIPHEIRAKLLLTPEHISKFVETAFWASLRFNEGRATRINLIAASREYFTDSIELKSAVPYDESQIVRLAPAISREGCLFVSPLENVLSIWGVGRTQRPPGDGGGIRVLGIRIVDPAVVRIDIESPFAVIDHSTVMTLGGREADFGLYLERIWDKKFPKKESIHSYRAYRAVDLTRMILAHDHGGIILFVPRKTGAWTKSLNPFAYRFAEPDKTIPDDVPLESFVLGIPPSIRSTAALAGVDGAIVATGDLAVLGFGATIAVGNQLLPPAVCLIRLQDGKQGVFSTSLEKLGGTRHQSAARFIAANQGSVAIVISQDRNVSVMHWEETMDAVVVFRNAEWWV